MRFFLLLPLIIAMSGCLVTKETRSLDETVATLKEGDLPLVDSKTLDKMVRESKIPVAVMLTAEWCHICKSVKGDFWRSARAHHQKFIGVILDVDKNPDFNELHKSPPLPTVMIFEKGGERWVTSGADGLKKALAVLEQNTEGFLTSLKTAAASERPAHPKVFLVAASADSANFVQEVADQFEYWKSRGLKDDEIACYYSQPNFGQYWEDRKQFKTLSQFAARCRRADLSLIGDDWRRSAKEKKDWMHLYVTSHGAGSLQGKKIESAIRTLDAKKKLNFKSADCSQHVTPHILFDLPQGKKEAADAGDILHDARSACEKNASTLKMLTRDRLTALMNDVPKNTSVSVVIQGCHSGAVIPTTLSENAVVLTAASADRSSFGCDVGGESTVYGRSFLKALNAVKPNPASPADWLRLHESVDALVTAEETKLGISPDRQSRPVIMSGTSINVEN